MKLQINLFGNFELTYGDNSIDEIDTPRQQEFLAYLLLNRDKAIPRSQLSYLFWLNSSERQAKANLRNLLHFVRKNLPDADQYIKVDHNNIKWKNTGSVELDVEEFEKSIKNARIAEKNNKLDVQEDELKNSIALYNGPLVPNCYSDWIEDYRKNYKRTYIEGLQDLINLLETKREYDEAIHFGNKLIKTEPYDEKAWRLLIKLYALNNDRAKAIRCYNECVKTLRDELDIEPSYETIELYEQILKHYQSDPDKEKKIKSNREFSTPLIGHKKEWQNLLNNWEKVVRGSNKFVLLRGESKIGKTRIGVELLEKVKRQGYCIAFTKCHKTSSKLGFDSVAKCLKHPSIYPNLDRLDPVWKVHLVKIMPELLADYPSWGELDTVTENISSRHLFEAISRAFLVSDKPTLLMLDDIQWCDEKTIEWVSYHFGSYESGKLLVVGTMRSDIDCRDTKLENILDDLSKEKYLDTIHLEGLDEDETATLLSKISAENFDEDINDQVYKLTDGNPGQILELMSGGNEEISQINRKDNKLKTNSETLNKERSSKDPKGFNGFRLLSGKNDKNPFDRLRGLGNIKTRNYTIVLLSIILLVIWIFKIPPDYTVFGKESKDTIAILPFKDLSDEKRDGRFTQGMTDVLNNNLARVQNFRVISYNTVDYYSKNYEQARLISDLNLDYLIEGSVQILQDKVRINIQVLNAKTNEYIWSNSYMRLLGDVLILQNHIAEDIVGRIESAFQKGNELNLPNPGKVNPVAFELYLKGIEEQSKKDILGFRQSANLFRQSISLDSSFTLAYSNLGFTYIMLELMDTEANYEKEITTVIDKALELNPNSSMTYVARGMYQHLIEYQWALADESFKMSIELNASSDVAHHEYAHFLMRWGKFEKALHHERTALSLNPISPDLQSGLGEIFLFKRDYERAIKELKKALDIDPTYVVVNFWLTRAYIHNQEYEKALETNNNFTYPRGYNFKSEILAYMGQKGEALDLLRELKNDFVRSPYKTILAEIIYVTYIALEEKQEALNWFEQAFEHETGWMSYMKVNPALDYIRDEPRFKEIQSKIFPKPKDF